jgi:hypothetical protein
MPFDDLKYYGKATRGDLGGVALKTSIALSHIAMALRAQRNGNDIDMHIDEIEKRVVELDEIFDELTGWTSDGG